MCMYMCMLLLRCMYRYTCSAEKTSVNRSLPAPRTTTRRYYGKISKHEFFNKQHMHTLSMMWGFTWATYFPATLHG